MVSRTNLLSQNFLKNSISNLLLNIERCIPIKHFNIIRSVLWHCCFLLFLLIIFLICENMSSTKMIQHHSQVDKKTALTQAKKLLSSRSYHPVHQSYQLCVVPVLFFYYSFFDTIDWQDVVYGSEPPDWQDTLNWE